MKDSKPEKQPELSQPDLETIGKLAGMFGWEKPAEMAFRISAGTIRIALAGRWFRQDHPAVAELLKIGGPRNVEHVLVSVARTGADATEKIAEWCSANGDAIGYKPATCLVCSIGKARMEDNLEPIGHQDWMTTCLGLFALCNGKTLTEKMAETLLPAIDPLMGDLPVSKLTHARFPLERISYSDTLVRNALIFATDGYELTITYKGGKGLKTAKASAIVANPERITLKLQDFEILATAFYTALKNPCIGKFKQTTWVVTLRHIAQAYFPKAELRGGRAEATIEEALDRLHRFFLRNVDIQDLIEKGRTEEIAGYGDGLKPLWPGEKTMVKSQEKAGKRKKGETMGEQKLEPGYRLETIPILYALASPENLDRLRPLSREIRPAGLPCDPDTEEIFVKLAKRAQMVSESPTNGRILMVNEKEPDKGIILPGDSRKVAARKLEVVERILKYWAAHEVACVKFEFEKNRKGTDVLVAAEITPPRCFDENGNEIENLGQRGAIMRERIEGKNWVQVSGEVGRQVNVSGNTGRKIRKRTS